MFYSKSTNGFYTHDVNGENMPNDVIAITVETYQALMEGQSQGMIITSDESGLPVLIEKVLSDDELLATYVGAVQIRLDTFAKTRGYDGIMSAATYTGSTIAKFASEAATAILARDTTWQKCYEILNDVNSGSRPAPSIQELLSELPELTWGD